MDKQSHPADTQSKTRSKPQESAGGQLMGGLDLAAWMGFDQALANGDGDRQSQAARLSDRRFLPIQRAALASRIGRRHGNHHLQLLLSGSGQPYGVTRPGRPAAAVQRQEEGSSADEPTPEQKAAALAAASAAEAQAGQSAQQARAETGQSKSAGRVEKQAAQAAKQKTSQARSAAKAIKSRQGKRKPAGLDQPAALAVPAGPGIQGAVVPDQAPDSPEKDPAFQQVVARAKRAARTEKKHAPAGKKAAQAQAAAVVPAKEIAGRAQANQTGAMEAAPAPAFNGAAFKAALMARIAALAPRTTSEADNFKGSGKLSGVKSEMAAKAGQEGAAAKDPMQAAAGQAPDTGAVAARPASPLPPPAPGPGSAIAGAAGAAPKPKTAAQIEKPIQENTRSIDDQMQAAEVTEDQLANSNEPEFKGALDARQEAKTQAETGPQAFRQAEQDAIGQAQAEAGSLAEERTSGMHADRAGLFGQVAGQQDAAKSKDEQERLRVGAEINTIYEQTKSKVESILSALDGKVSATFDRGADEARQAFENYVDARVKAYKQRRYGGWFGWARWAKDKLLGMPSEVNGIYRAGRQLFLARMDAVIDNVVAIIVAGLSEAKAEIANGKKRIQEYLSGLPENLQQVGQQAAQEIQGRFEALESSVDSKQNELIDSLAKKYNDTLSAVDARIDELKAANQGLVQKALNAVVGAIKIILKLKDMLLSVLSRVAGVIGKIIKHPIEFLGNLISGVSQGFTNFAKNLKKHLIGGLVGWLTGALGPLGIQLPDDLFSLKGIFSLLVQVLGISWDTIRARAVKLLGEPVVKALEQGFELFQVLVSEGPQGLWKFLKDQFGDLKETVLGAIEDMIQSEVVDAGVEWIMGLMSPAGAFIKAAKAIYKIVMFFVEKGSQVMELVNSVIDGIGAIASGAIGGAAGLIENALARALPLVIGFLASLLGLDDLAKKVQGVIAKVRGKVDQAIDWVIEKARKAAGPLLGRLGLGRAGEKQPGAKAAAGGKMSVDETDQAEKGEFKPQDRKLGLAAFAREERPFAKNGKISQQDANKVAAAVQHKHPVFQSITVVDGQDSWNYRVIFKAEAVDTPTQKAEGGIVDVSSIRKYRPNWRKTIKQEFAALYPDLHAKGLARLIAGFERRHITSYDQLKNDMFNQVDGKSYQEAAAILGVQGYPPAKETNASILAAVKKYLRDRFNDVINVFVGESADNQERGRKMGAAKRAMRQAAAQGNTELFRQAYDTYRLQAFDPEPIDYFYDIYKPVRERV